MFFLPGCWIQQPVRTLCLQVQCAYHSPCNEIEVLFIPDRLELSPIPGGTDHPHTQVKVRIEALIMYHAHRLHLCFCFRFWETSNFNQFLTVNLPNLRIRLCRDSFSCFAKRSKTVQTGTFRRFASQESHNPSCFLFGKARKLSINIIR